MMRLFSLIFCAAFFSCCEAAFLRPSGPYQVDRNLARQLKEEAQFTVLGQTLASSPSCLSRDGRETHCFFVTSDKTIGYASVVDSQATFEDFGGSVVNLPETVGYGRDGVFALFMTPEKKLVVTAVKTQTDYDKNVTELDFGSFLEVPGCVTLEKDDEIFCVVRSTNGGMHTFNLRNGQWGNYYFITDNPEGPLSCVLNTVAHRIHCWSILNGRLSERLFRDTGLPDGPFWFTGGQPGRGRVNVYMLGVIPLPRGLCSTTQRMVDIFGNYGGTLTSAPYCANANSRSLDCFALDESHGLQRDYQSVGFLYVRRTSGWVHYGGKFVGNPSCIFMSGDSKFHCYMRSQDNTLVEAKLNPLDSGMTVLTT